MFQKIIVIMLVSCFILSGLISIMPAPEQNEVSSTTFGSRATLIVGPDQAYTTIGAAIASASPGDVIRVYSGTYNEEITLDKTLTLIGNGSANTTIKGSDTASVVTINGAACNVSGFTITGCPTPIHAGVDISTDFNWIMDCNLSGNGHGIVLQGSCKNLFRDLQISDNNGYGIEFLAVNPWPTSSDYNTLVNCTFERNGQYGIYLLHFAAGNIIRNCRSSENGFGIYLVDSSDNVISNNSFNDNYRGMYLWRAVNNNIIKNNDFINNSNLSIEIEPNVGPMSGNKIYHNNFIGNNGGGIQASDNSTKNNWNISEGNHWSDWTLPDADDNGIVDVPYSLAGTGGAQDHYPLADLVGVPRITTAGIETAIEDSLYYVDYLAWDLDTQPSALKWSLHTNATWLDMVQNILSGTPDNTHVGSYWVNVSVTDGRYTDSTNFTVSVHNTPPSIATSNTVSAIEDMQYRVDYNSTDDGQGTITWSLNTNSSWLFLNSTSGVVHGTPSNNDTGTSWVNVSVTDGNGGSDWTNFTLKVLNTNDAPMISSIDNLTAYEDSLYFCLYAATDVDDTVFTWTLCTDAPWLDISATDNLSGIPRNEDVGEHWVNVSVSDPHLASDFRNFTLTVINTNDPPIWSDTPLDIAMILGETFTFDVNASDVDVGDIVLFGISSSPSSFITVDTQSGLIEWTPTEADDYLVNLTATDSNATIYYEFWINVSKYVKPNSVPSSVLLYPENNTRVYVLNPTFEWTATDADGDNVTCDLYCSRTLDDVQILHALSKTGTNLTGNTYTPTTPLDKGAVYYWTVIPHDGKDYGFCVSGIRSFSVSDNATMNHLPVFQSLPPLDASVGFEWRYTPMVTDEDNDTVTISIDLGPGGMTLASGDVSWTPVTSQLGPNEVRLKAYDGKSYQFQEFTIIVNNDAPINHPPEIEAIPNQVLTAGKILIVQVVATDGDGDELTYNPVLSVHGKSITINDNGLITWQTSEEDIGDYSISVSVTDGKAITDLTFNVTVVAPQPSDDDDGGTDGMIAIGVLLLAMIIITVVVLLLVKKKNTQREDGISEESGALMPEMGKGDLFTEKEYMEMKRSQGESAEAESDVINEEPMEAVPDEDEEDIDVHLPGDEQEPEEGDDEVILEKTEQDLLPPINTGIDEE